MNDVVSEIAIPRKDVTLGRGHAKGLPCAGAIPAAFDDLLHDLRQPLSAIDSLAYFLEITSPDESVREHLQRIQAMVARAHGILDRSSNLQSVSSSAA